MAVAIQAGGKSIRFGENKALIKFDGEVLIARVARIVSTISSELFIIGNEKEQLSFTGLTIIPDAIPGIGAIGGLYTALTSTREEFLAIVACDLPYVNPGILLKALELIEETESDVGIPCVGEDKLEPLHAVYRRESCEKAVIKAINAGKHRLVSWFDDVKVIRLQPDLLHSLDPEGLAFININTREDLHKAENSLRQK